MNENNKTAGILSDLALERVMRDVLSDIWEIAPQKMQQAVTESATPPDAAADESEESP